MRAPGPWARRPRPGWSRSLAPVPPAIRRLRDAERAAHLGQVDPEAGAASRSAVRPDVPVRLLHDAVHRREPEPASLPHRLGGEERLEDPLQSLGIHSRAGVGHGDADVVAGPDLDAGVRHSELAVEPFPGGGDGQPTTRCHGIAGVEREVEQDLLQLALVGEYQPGIGREVEGHLAVRTHELADQAPHSRECRVEFEQLGVQKLPPGEGEQLPRHVGAAAGRLADLRHIVLLGAGEPARSVHELGEPQDHRHHVVDLVRDAARELPRRLEPLSLLQPILGGPLPGHVGHHAHRARATAFRTPAWDGRRPGPGARGAPAPFPSSGRPSASATNGGSGTMASAGTSSVSARPRGSVAPTMVSKAALHRSMHPCGSTTQTPSPIASNVARQADLRRPRLALRGPGAEQCAHGCQQHQRLDRMREVAVRATVESRGLALGIGEARRHVDDGQVRDPGSARTRRTTSKPSMPGIRMSSTMRSGSCWAMYSQRLSGRRPPR